MKFSTFSLLSLAGFAAAWEGQLSADPQNVGEGGIASTNVHLLDYNTGSRYTTTILPGWTPSEQYVCFAEDGSGAYNFPAALWQTYDGCYNIDFEGAFGGAGHGYCCDGLPCDITA
ncbi:hypothetical protein ACHAPV_010242 [Trichoderma viride]